MSYNSQSSHFSCEQTHLFQQNYSCGSEFAGLYLLTQLSSHLIAYDNAKIIFSMVNMFYHTYLQSSFSPPLNCKNKSSAKTLKQVILQQPTSHLLHREKVLNKQFYFKSLCLHLIYSVSEQSQLSHFHQITQLILESSNICIYKHHLSLKKSQKLNGKVSLTINRAWNKSQTYL